MFGFPTSCSESCQVYFSLNVSPFTQKFFAPEPIRPECRSPRVRSPTSLEHTGSVRPYSIYVLKAYYGLCDAKNTDGALAKISSYFLDNIKKLMDR